LCAVFLSVALGQETGKVAFEVASIKAAKPMPMGQIQIGMNVDGGMLQYSNVSLRECIRAAYRVKDFQVEGPDWLGSARFDIVAKLPEESSKSQVPEMLQALLAERFKLALHRDSREHAVCAMVVAKGGAKLKPTEIVPAGDPAPGPNAGPGETPRGTMETTMDTSGMHFKASAVPLAALADLVSHLCERPVVDQTGIEGRYDFDLAISPETLRDLPAGGAMTMRQGGGEPPQIDARAEPAGSIFEALQRYGLKLEPRKAPMEVLTVDRIEKEPTAN